jgi:hypothetical protein
MLSNLGSIGRKGNKRISGERTEDQCILHFNLVPQLRDLHCIIALPHFSLPGIVHLCLSVAENFDAPQMSNRAIQASGLVVKKEQDALALGTKICMIFYRDNYTVMSINRYKQ